MTIEAYVEVIVVFKIDVIVLMSHVASRRWVIKDHEIRGNKNTTFAIEDYAHSTLTRTT